MGLSTPFKILTHYMSVQWDRHT